MWVVYRCIGVLQATTTAAVTGLVLMELYKVVRGDDKVDNYRNGTPPSAFILCALRRRGSCLMVCFHVVGWDGDV